MDTDDLIYKHLTAALDELRRRCADGDLFTSTKNEIAERVSGQLRAAKTPRATADAVRIAIGALELDHLPPETLRLYRWNAFGQLPTLEYVKRRIFGPPMPQPLKWNRLDAWTKSRCATVT